MLSRERERDKMMIILNFFEAGERPFFSFPHFFISFLIYTTITITIILFVSYGHMIGLMDMLLFYISICLLLLIFYFIYSFK